MDRPRSEPFPRYVDDPHKSLDVVDAAISARRDMLVNMERQSGVWYGQERRGSRGSWTDSQATTPRDRRTMDSTNGGFRVPTHLSLHIPYNAASPAASYCYSPIDPDEKYDRPPGDDAHLAGPPQPAQPPVPPQIALSTTHEILFITTVCLAQFLSLAALAQTVAPLLLIGADLKVENPGQLSWFTASFSMTLGTFILPAGMFHTLPLIHSTLHIILYH
jgi:hypothetical protein